jgi:hypothetical protein
MNRSNPVRLPLALAATALLALGACKGQQSPADSAPGTPVPQSSEWATESPADPKVPVELPTTPMTNVPPAEAAASPSPAAS